jgi:hypothetical protein
MAKLLGLLLVAKLYRQNDNGRDAKKKRLYPAQHRGNH